MQTNGATYYTIAKQNFANKRLDAIRDYRTALTRSDLTEADVAFLNKQIAHHTAATFPTYHPGEW